MPPQRLSLVASISQFPYDPTTKYIFHLNRPSNTVSYTPENPTQAAPSNKVLADRKPAGKRSAVVGTVAGTAAPVAAAAHTDAQMAAAHPAHKAAHMASAHRALVDEAAVHKPADYSAPRTPQIVAGADMPPGQSWSVLDTTSGYCRQDTL